jgi:threonine dehydratase
MIDYTNHPISLTETLKARKIVYEHLTPTALIRYDSLCGLLNAEVYVKHENHNPTGSFKIRGGINLCHYLKQANVSGVITFSTGNHGLSIAKSADLFGISATVVVPENNNPVKNNSIKATGATLIEAGTTFEESSEAVDEILKRDNLYFAHPANEPHLINGVGTEFLELIEAIPDLDAVIVPIGAGSEAAAATRVLKQINPKIMIYAVQAESSCAAYKSWMANQIVTSSNTTFAGGFATGTGYEIPFEVYKDALADFILLSEEEIYNGIALAAHYTHNLVEGAGGSTLMAAIKLKQELMGKKVALQFSGCNATPHEINQAYSSRYFTHGWQEG